MARKVRGKSTKQLSTAAWFAIGCGSVLALALIAAVIVLIMIKSSPAPPPEATISESASPAAVPAAPPLEQQIQAAEQAVRSQGMAQVTLLIRADELNALIARRPPPNVRNLRVYFGNGTIAATGDVTLRGQNLHLTVRGTPVVADGQVHLQVQEVRVGRLGAPEAIRAQVERDLQGGISELIGGNRLRVEAVSVAPGVMTVRGWAGRR